MIVGILVAFGRPQDQRELIMDESGAHIFLFLPISMPKLPYLSLFYYDI